MAFPVLEKKWQFQRADGTSTLNMKLGGQNGATDRRWVLVEMIKSMVGFRCMPWTVKAQSYYNGSSWAVETDGINRWLTPSNIGWSDSRYTDPHAWVILHNPALNYDILFNCFTYGSVESQIQMKWSPGALYTASGTPAAPPTAADAVTLIADSGYWIDARNQWYYSSIYRLNVMHSVDGCSTRILVYSDDQKPCVFMFEHVVDTVGTWDHPYCICPDLLDNPMTFADLGNSTRWFMVGNDHTLLRPYLSVETGFLSSYNPIPELQGGAKSTLTGKYTVCPFGVWSSTTNYRGALGRFVDMWLGSSAIDDGSVFTEGGYRFAQWGRIVVPWDATKTCETD